MFEIEVPVKVLSEVMTPFNGKVTTAQESTVRVQFNDDAISKLNAALSGDASVIHLSPAELAGSYTVAELAQALQLAATGGK